MASASELQAAFDAAIEQARQAIRQRMVAISGEPAQPSLQKLISTLEEQRDRAVESGAVDGEWFQNTVRWVVEWAPDSDLSLIAALGRIARAAPKHLDK